MADVDKALPNVEQEINVPSGGRETSRIRRTR
jgi:hypothetical protein